LSCSANGSTLTQPSGSTSPFAFITVPTELACRTSVSAAPQATSPTRLRNQRLDQLGQRERLLPVQVARQKSAQAVEVYGREVEELKVHLRRR